MFNAIASIVGSGAVFVSYLFFEQKSLNPFRFFCVITAIVASFGFYYTSKHVPTRSIDANEEDEETRYRPTPYSVDTKAKPRAELSFVAFARQLLKHTNFWVFVAVNFVQVFQVAFSTNFFTIFLDYFLDGTQRTDMWTANNWFKSIVVTSSILMPAVSTILLAPLVNKCGYYNVIRWSFFAKIFSSMFVYLLCFLGPPYNGLIIAFFMILSSVLSASPFQYFSIVISDLAEEDYVRNIKGRESLLSAMFFGANALITKPAQSVAPTLGWYILSSFGFAHGHGKTVVVSPGLDISMFQVLAFVPFVCGTIQMYLWTRYTLQGDYLVHIKAVYQEQKKQ